MSPNNLLFLSLYLLQNKIDFLLVEKPQQSDPVRKPRSLRP